MGWGGSTLKASPLFDDFPMVIARKSNPKIMCNMTNVASILVIYFADPELWTENYENWDYFFHGRLPATKGDIWTQKVTHSSPNSYIGKVKKRTIFSTIFFGHKKKPIGGADSNRLNSVHITCNT